MGKTGEQVTRCDRTKLNSIYGNYQKKYLNFINYLFPKSKLAIFTLDQFKIKSYPLDARDEFVYKTDLTIRAKQAFTK